jgi:hypothetical protein
VPSGVLGGVRIVAFAAVTLGAILLAQPDRGGPTRVDAPRRAEMTHTLVLSLRV